MSNESQRGYLFGILQRGARPTGFANRARRMRPAQRPIEQCATLEFGVTPLGENAPGEPLSSAGLNETTQSLNQTNQRPRLQSGPRAPTQTADTSPELPTATEAGSSSLSQPGKQRVASSSDRPKLSTTAAHDQSFPAVELNGATPTIHQTKHQKEQVAHPQSRQSRPYSPSDVAGAAPDAPGEAATRASSFSPPESSVEINSATQTVNQAERGVHPQTSRSSSRSPGHAANAWAETPTATVTRSRIPSPPPQLPVDASPNEVQRWAANTLLGSSPQEQENGTTNQARQVPHPRSSLSAPNSLGHAADASTAKPTATATRSGSFSQPELQAANPSTAPEKRSPTGFTPAVFPDTDPDPTKANLVPAATPLTATRLPKLIVIEQGGKTISSDNPSSDTKEQSGIEISEEIGSVMRPQRFADPATRERGRSSTQPLQGNVAIIQTVTQLDEAPLVESRRPQEKAARSQSRQPESSESVVASLPETTPELPLAHFRGRPSDAIAEPAKVTFGPAQAERKEEALVSPAFPPEQNEAQFSSKAFSTKPQGGEPTPKLTINRLDVQIVNQSTAPTLPTPTAPAPPVISLPSDTWEKLERHQLGHLSLLL